LQDGGKVIGVGPQAQLKIFDFGKCGRSFAFDLRMFMRQTREVTIDHACRESRFRTGCGFYALCRNGPASLGPLPIVSSFGGKR
jgi:hypothetical protein